MKTVRVWGASCIAALSLGAAAGATPLPPGTSGRPISSLGYGGTVDTVGDLEFYTSSFSATGSLSVYSDPNNTFGSGDLDFVYQFSDVTGDAIERLTASNFAGVSVDVGYSAVAGGVAPLYADRSSSGGVIGFDFTGADDVAPGQTSDVLVIQTNSRSYQDYGGVSLQDSTASFIGGIPGPVPAAPSAPEPDAWVLIIVGVGLSGVYLRVRPARRREDEFAF